MRELDQPEPLQLATERQAEWAFQLDRAARISSQLHPTLDKYPAAQVEINVDPAGEEKHFADIFVMRAADHMMFSRVESLTKEGLGDTATAIVQRYFPPEDAREGRKP